MADTRTETPADELRAAVQKLGTGSPVHAPGRARILGDSTEGIHPFLTIAICKYHDDPADLPANLDRNGCCGNCIFVKAYDRGLARQLVALLNAREPLASWLEEVADEAERHEAQGMGNAQDEVIYGPCLAVARVLNGAPS